MPAEVFISYSTRDLDRVQAFVEKLESANVDVWFDKGSIPEASRWSEEIVEGIEECKVFLFLGSEKACSSKTVGREIALAYESSCIIYPVHLEPIVVPRTLKLQLAGLQYTEMFEDDDEKVGAIVRALDRMGVSCEAKPSERMLAEPPRGLLTFEDSGDVHRLFLLGKDLVGFGKAKSERNPRVDITTRVLPLRSKELDPENWDQTTRLSSHHGNVVFEDGKFFLEDLSTNGIFIKVGGGTAQSELFGSATFRPITARDGPMPTVARCGERMNRSFPILEQVCFSLGEDLLEVEATVLRSEDGPVRGLHMVRLDNLPEHSYLQILSEVTIGSMQTADVGFVDPIGSEFVVKVEREKGHYSLCVVDGTVVMNGEELTPGVPRKLEHGTQLVMGHKVFEFTHARDDDFTKA